MHEREEIHMRKFYTAEAVTEGHPDKVCDQIADAILDMCLKNDADSKVACEVLATKGTVIVAGEITSTYEPDVFGVIQKVCLKWDIPAKGLPWIRLSISRVRTLPMRSENPKKKGKECLTIKWIGFKVPGIRAS